MVFLLALFLLPPARADWPAWRGDARRSATTAAELPGKLSLHWKLSLPGLEPAWPDQPRLAFDVCYQPVIAGGRIFLSSSRNDSVSSYSLEDGSLLWRFFAGGPVRFAPFAASGKLYFSSDDGYLYCLDAGDGSLIWRYRGGPSGRKVTGNGRIVSSWPARGAPVVRDGKVFFGAGIWPFMGTYVHCLDAEDGTPVWTNSADGALYLDQPHNSPAFGGLAPQGYLAATGDRLLVPNGRAIPACLDGKTGELLYYNLSKNAKKESYHVSTTGGVFLNSGLLYDLNGGARIKGTLSQDAALDSGAIYSAAVVQKEEKGKKNARLQLRELRLGNRIRFDRNNFHLRWADRRRGATYEVSVRGAKVEKFVKISKSKAAEELELISYVVPNKHKNFAGKSVEAGILSYRDSLLPASLLGKEGGKPVETICRAAIYLEPANWTCKVETGIPLSAVKATGKKKPGLGGLGALPTGKFERISARGRLVEVEKLRNVDGEISRQVLFRKLPRGLKRQLELSPSWRFAQALASRPAAGAEGALTVRAGNRVYVACEGTLMAFDIPSAKPTAKKRPRFAWKKKLQGVPGALACSDGYLLVATEAGKIFCFGGEREEAPIVRNEAGRPLPGQGQLPPGLAGLLKDNPPGEGYCLVDGGGSLELIQGLIADTRLRLLVFEESPQKLAALRRKLDRAGQYGTRVSVYPGTAGSFALPPYLAKLVIHKGSKDGTRLSAEAIAVLFNALRPYGGVAFFQGGTLSRQELEDAARGQSLAGAEIKVAGESLTLHRRGPLPRSGSWTHQYGDGANSNLSRDSLVRAPLGVLWFGGASNTRLLPRHGHGPRHLVVGGRIIIEGPDVLRSLDVYTGRLLWEAEFPGLGNAYDNTSHQPGANAIGSNYVATADAVYVLYGKACLKLDPKTGEVASRIQFGDDGASPRPQHLGFIGVHDEVLVLGASPIQFSTPDFDQYDFNKLPDKQNEELKVLLESFKGFKPSGKSFLQTQKSWMIAQLNKLIKLKDLPANLSAALRKAADKKKLSAVEKLIRLHEENGGTADGLKSLNRRFLCAVCSAVPQERTGKLGHQNVWDGTASRYLGGFDRRSGKMLWRLEAQNSFRHNAICLGSGKVFAVDRLPETYDKKLRRRGRSSRDSTRVLAAGLSDGVIAWKQKAPFYGTFVSYSAEHDILLQSSRASRDMLPDEKGNYLLAHRGKTGEVLWKTQDTYDGPCILYHDTIITQGKAYELLTGKRKKRLNPVLQKEVEWGFSRHYGCNTAIASEHLLTFRSAAAGFFDLKGNSGTGNLGGFRSSCTANLIVGDGVL
ncbi:MAG: PQQ-binding-like beta-propeller repeat protein, partial [Planctomycetota bacterium]|nr:PQQ-binding-like beta-propeller repeat protein [Planctomycetota bacterium]